MKIEDNKIIYRVNDFAITKEDNVYIIYRKFGMFFIKIGFFHRPCFEAVTDLIDFLETDYAGKPGVGMERDTLCPDERSTD